MIENVKIPFKSYKSLVLKKETSYLQGEYEKESVRGGPHMYLGILGRPSPSCRQ